MKSAGRAVARFAFGVCAAVLLALGCAPPDDARPVVLELHTTGSRTVFMPDTLSAPVGARVTLRLINEGEIAHNLVLVRDEEAVQPIVLAAYQSIATEYVPTGFADHILASAPLVYPGQSYEVSFVMPERGRYPFVCVFPGHGSTMRGELVSR